MVNGPLTGVKILEFAWIGPGPCCGQLLADMGAHVTVVDRPKRVGRAIRAGQIGLTVPRLFIGVTKQ